MAPSPNRLQVMPPSATHRGLQAVLLVRQAACCGGEHFTVTTITAFWFFHCTTMHFLRAFHVHAFPHTDVSLVQVVYTITQADTPSPAD